MFKRAFIKKYKEKVSQFIDESYVACSEQPIKSRTSKKGAQITIDGDIKYSLRTPVEREDAFNSEKARDRVKKYLLGRSENLILTDAKNLTFTGKLIRYIWEKNLVQSSVYKAALMDRRLFSKIISDNEYKPSKDTAIALAFALKLTLSETQDLLSRAGYTLSHSIKRDIILEFFIEEKVYNLNKINCILYELGEKIIGK